MNFEDYKNKNRYPDKRDFSTYYAYSRGKVVFEGNCWDKKYFEDTEEAQGVIWETILDEKSYLEAENEYKNEAERLYEKFWQDAAADLGIHSNHPKLAKMRGFAYQEGHSGGFNDMYLCLANIWEVVKD